MLFCVRVFFSLSLSLRLCLRSNISVFSSLHIFAFHEIVFSMYTIYVYHHQIRAPNVSKRKKKLNKTSFSYGHSRRCGFCFFFFRTPFGFCVSLFYSLAAISHFRENKAQRFLHSCRSFLLLLLFQCL